MEKKLETREDGKTRIVLKDGSMGTPWFKTQEHALRAIGRAVLLDRKDKERLRKQAKREKISLSDVIRIKLTRP